MSFNNEFCTSCSCFRQTRFDDETHRFIGVLVCPATGRKDCINNAECNTLRAPVSSKVRSDLQQQQQQQQQPVKCKPRMQWDAADSKAISKLRTTEEKTPPQSYSVECRVAAGQTWKRWMLSDPPRRWPVITSYLADCDILRLWSEFSLAQCVQHGRTSC